MHHDNAQTSHRKMLMGTTLSHLQKQRRTQRRGLGWQSTKSAKNAAPKPSAPDNTKPSAAESPMPTARNPLASPITKQTTCWETKLSASPTTEQSKIIWHSR